MKQIINKLLLIFVLLDCCAQSNKNESENGYDLVGVWQADRYDEAAAWPDTYQFFSDGKFVFNFSQYDGSKRILRILGTYRLETGKVYLKVEFTEEAVGGYLTRSTITSLSDTWELTDFLVEMVKQSNSEDEIVNMEACKEQYPKDCLLLDKRKYYRMSRDPEKYD